MESLDFYGTFMKLLWNFYETFFDVLSYSFSRETFTERKPKEPKEIRNLRAVIMASKWYTEHLKHSARSPTVLILTNTDKELPLIDVPAMTGALLNFIFSNKIIFFH